MVYALFISFAEIYNEKAFDLLESIPVRGRARTMHTLGEDREGCSYIKGKDRVQYIKGKDRVQYIKGKDRMQYTKGTE